MIRLSKKKKDRKGEPFRFLTRIFINAAGLYSDRISLMAGIDNHDYRLKYCKGDYFRVHHNKGRFLSHLIYPTPADDSVSLGIHTVLDLAGGLRLGPDAKYVNAIEYTVDENKAEIFYEDVRRCLPFIQLSDLSADTSGIRPKLQSEGEDFRDFVIKEESDRDFAGFVNLIGIDSPGLTCCFSIAKEVSKIIESFC